MGFITKYGSFWGQLPVTSGRVFWVAPTATYTVEGRSYSASDGNDGLSPERAVLTLDYAVGLCTANVGDVIVMLPGAHSYSAAVAADVAGITITGLPRGDAMPGVRGAGVFAHAATLANSVAAANIINVSADNIEIAYLHFIPITAGGGIGVAAANLNIHDCTFDMITPVGSTATECVQITGATSALRIANCTVRSDAGQGPFFGDSSGSDTITLLDVLIERCLFMHSGTTAWAAVMAIASGATNVVVRDCDVQASSGGAITTFINVTGNTTDDSVMIMRVDGNLTLLGLVTGTATSDIVLLNNYIATIDGGTGGTLRTT